MYRAEDNGATELIRTLKEYFSTFGIAKEITSDGGPQYKSTLVRDFLKDWGVSHRVSSSYFPHSNQRAEQGVKSAKRMLRENVAADGSLKQDRFLRALMLHRNTPDRDTGLSPAQVIFGKAIREFFPIKEGNLRLHPEWRITMEQRERALARRHAKREKDLQEHTKILKPLRVGQVVMVQNQVGNSPTRWDKSGIVVELLDFDRYKIKLDGSGRISIRNRRFLKPIKPFVQSEVVKDAGDRDDWEPGHSRDDWEPGQSRDELVETTAEVRTGTRTRAGRISYPVSRWGISSFTCSWSSQRGRT